jgi:hypothetical protein
MVCAMGAEVGTLCEYECPRSQMVFSPRTAPHGAALGVLLPAEVHKRRSPGAADGRPQTDPLPTAYAPDLQAEQSLLRAIVLDSTPNRDPGVTLALIRTKLRHMVTFSLTDLSSTG